MLATLSSRLAVSTIATGCESKGTMRDWLTTMASAERKPGCVLMHAPSFAFQAPGGGENQLVQTAKHLEAAGTGVRLFSPWVDQIEDYKILHLFGMSREGLELARIAKQRGVQVVLSPICWLEPKALMTLASSWPRGVWHRAKWMAKGMIPQISGWRDQLIQQADLILPNSMAEAGQLNQLFLAQADRITVIPNGVDGRFETADPLPFRAIHGPEAFVLYTGRIEPRKNVLGLIRASRSLGRKLVVIGNAPPGHEAYLIECKKLGGQFVQWYGGVEHDDPMLASAYAAARVFALPSWFETPGLAALEAALAGTAIVLTPNGCTREYFGDRVEYAHPDRTDSIANALESAWNEGPKPGLQALVKSQFLWTNVAQRTAEAYDLVMR